MCLSTAYMESGGEQLEIMKDVARVEADDGGFWLINLFGERHFVEGTIQTIDFVDSHFIRFGKRGRGDGFERQPEKD